MPSATFLRFCQKQKCIVKIKTAKSTLPLAPGIVLESAACFNLPGREVVAQSGLFWNLFSEAAEISSRKNTQRGRSGAWG